MELVVAGSGTVALQPDRVCSGYWLETAAERLLLDCGPGTPHQLARLDLPWSRIDVVALTHFHTDHIAGLPLLLFALKHGLRQPRSAPLRIVGPRGTRDLLGRLAEAFGEYVLDPGFPLHVEELEADTPTRLRGGQILAHPTPHTTESVAYRVEAEGASLGYTGDTGASDELAAFFEGVDVLLAECSLPDEAALDSHLTPSRVARLATLARPRRLLVTHVFPQLNGRDVPELIRRAGWDGPVELVRDGHRLRIGAG